MPASGQRRLLQSLHEGEAGVLGQQVQEALANHEVIRPPQDQCGRVLDPRTSLESLPAEQSEMSTASTSQPRRAR
jgi:hypothetical protein